jgi:hypothetical protein
MSTATKAKPKCRNCWTDLLAGPSGWICESCDAKIVPYGNNGPAVRDIEPSGAIPGRKLCEECEGTGSVECGDCAGDGYKVCDHCGSEVDCEFCDGEGDIECRECGGSGFEED